MENSFTLDNVEIGYQGYALTLKESKDYWPFGLELQQSEAASTVRGKKYPYGFNGKEEENSLGLNWNDYGARFFDPATAQFTTIDPKSEQFDFQTPYAYAANNPILFEEKNGENPIIRFLSKVFSRGNVRKVTKVSTQTVKTTTRSDQLLKSKKSYESLIKEHVQKLDDFMKDPIANSSKEALEQMTRDNPTKEVLLQRAKGRGKALEKQIKKQQGELDKINKELKSIEKGSGSSNVISSLLTIFSSDEDDESKKGATANLMKFGIEVLEFLTEGDFEDNPEGNAAIKIIDISKGEGSDVRKDLQEFKTFLQERLDEEGN